MKEINELGGPLSSENSKNIEPNNSTIKVGSRKAYLIFTGVALFFFYQYILRITPGLMEPELRLAFNMHASHFATLGSLYLVIYGILQIPIGFLVDKFGLRKIILVSVLCCVGGNFLLAIGHTLWMAQLSRVLAGIGSSSAYLGCLKVAADYIPKKWRGLFMGAALTLGLAGPLFFAEPIVALIQTNGWRETLHLLSLLGIALFVFLVIIFRFGLSNDDHEAPITTQLSNNKILGWINFKQIGQILFDRPILVGLAILTPLFYGPLATIADVWGAPFLSQCELNRFEAANLTMQIYLGAALGALIVPWLCGKYNLLFSGLLISWLLMLIFLLILIRADLFSALGFSKRELLQLGTLGIGIFSSSELLCFTAAANFSNPKTSGLIMGTLNTFSMLGGALLIYLIGWRLDCNWLNNVDAAGTRAYCLQDYIGALDWLLMLILIFGVIGFSIVWPKRKDLNNVGL